MATLSSNSPLQGMRGSLGGLVFRSFNGKTVVSAEPNIRRVKPKDQSDRQRQTRINFKEASQYAKTILRDERMREHYQCQARKLKLPNPYTAALKAYMRKNKEELVTPNHTGEAVKPAPLPPSHKSLQVRHQAPNTNSKVHLIPSNQSSQCPMPNAQCPIPNA